MIGLTEGDPFVMNDALTSIGCGGFKNPLPPNRSSNVPESWPVDEGVGHCVNEFRSKLKGLRSVELLVGDCECEDGEFVSGERWSKADAREKNAGLLAMVV